MSGGRVAVTSSGFGPSAREIPSFDGTIYVANWGNRGILIAVGGSDMQTVHVYDIDKERWYDQTATGDLPETRQDFCIAGAPSNNHTYEILIYGGWDGHSGPEAVRYDTAHVLTLPGFYWVKAGYPAAHPRHGLSCNAVGGGQVLIIGGVDTTQKASNGSSEHAAGFATRDPFPNGLAIFDLSKMAWSSVYRAKRPLQPAPTAVQAYYDTQ